MKHCTLEHMFKKLVFICTPQTNKKMKHATLTLTHNVALMYIQSFYCFLWIRYHETNSTKQLVCKVKVLLASIQ